MMTIDNLNTRDTIARRCVIPALVIPFIASLFYFLIIKDRVIARFVYLGAKAFLLGCPLLVYLLVARGHGRRPSTRRMGLGQAALRGVVSGVVISGIIYIAMRSPLGRMVEASADSIRERTEHLGIMGWYWTFSIFLSVLHSFIEEFYWRWFVFGFLNRVCSQWLAIVVSSVAFASHHVIITGQLLNWPLGILCGTGIAVGGAFWAWLYARTETLAAPWISHALVDFAVMAIGYQLIKGVQ
jgi:membrane protease YdiL (CAAX protease family)